MKDANIDPSFELSNIVCIASCLDENCGVVGLYTSTEFLLYGISLYREQFHNHLIFSFHHWSYESSIKTKYLTAIHLFQHISAGVNADGILSIGFLSVTIEAKSRRRANRLST